MSQTLDVLSWIVLALAAVSLATELLPIRPRRGSGQHAKVALKDWRMVRTYCGLILLTCIHWTHGVAEWPLLGLGCLLVVVWDLVSRLRTRYRLTRMG
jgi:hypothetical protein